MVLQFGDMRVLANQDWHALEIRNEDTVEVTLKRLGMALPNAFEGGAVQVFVPILKRDLDVYDLANGNYIYIRSTSLDGELSLRNLTGVVCIVFSGDRFSKHNIIPIADEYIQKLITMSELAWRTRSQGIKVGSFVRIVGSDCSNYCGTVMEIGDNVLVRVRFNTRYVYVTSPMRNLLNLDHVAENRRVCYYSTVVEDLDDPEVMGIDFMDPESTRSDAADISIESKIKKRYKPMDGTRHHTVSKIAQTMAAEGCKNPLEIAERIRQDWDELSRKPKSIHIMEQVIAMECRKAGVDMKAVRSKGHGLLLRTIVTMFEGLGVPTFTPKVIARNQRLSAAAKHKK